MAYASVNPYTGDVLKTFPEASDAEVERTVADAHSAFLAWRETSFAERGRILQKAADLLRGDSDAYARLLTLEMGKLVAEAKAEVELSAKIFEYYVRHAETLLQSPRTGSGAARSPRAHAHQAPRISRADCHVV